MKLDSSEMNSNLSFMDGNLNKKGSDVKLAELFIFQALDKVRKPKHKLYFHSYEYTILHYKPLSVLVSIPHLCFRKGLIFIKLYNYRIQIQCSLDNWFISLIGPQYLYL